MAIVLHVGFDDLVLWDLHKVKIEHSLSEIFKANLV